MYNGDGVTVNQYGRESAILSTESNDERVDAKEEQREESGKAVALITHNPTYYRQSCKCSNKHFARSILYTQHNLEWSPLRIHAYVTITNQDQN